MAAVSACAPPGGQHATLGGPLSITMGHLSQVTHRAWDQDVSSDAPGGGMVLEGATDHDPCVRNSYPWGHLEDLVPRTGLEVCTCPWFMPAWCPWPLGGTLSQPWPTLQLLVWNHSSLSPVQQYTEHLAAVKAIAWSPHQHGLLASGGGTADRCIRFWNTLTGQPLQCIDTGSQVCNLAWSKHANELVSAQWAWGR